MFMWRLCRGLGNPDFDISGIVILFSFHPCNGFIADPVRMRIRKPKHITIPQLAVVTAVGIVGGIYIYKPLFEKFWFGGEKVKVGTEIATSQQEQQPQSK